MSADLQYRSYLRYKKVIELINENEYSACDIFKITGIPESTIYHMINSLLKNNVIVVSKYVVSSEGNRNRFFKIYKLMIFIFF